MALNYKAEVFLLSVKESENECSHLYHHTVEIDNLVLDLEGCVILECFRFLKKVNVNVSPQH